MTTTNLQTQKRKISNIWEENSESKEESSQIAQTISNLTFKTFQTLPKKGKPQPNEWTILASIVIISKLKQGKFHNKVVALGTGSKCLGKNQMTEDGETIFDSHAEIICKRSFQIFLYNQLQEFFQTETNSDSIFEWKRNSNSTEIIEIKEDLEFHMFISQSPCGDASIFQISTQDTLESKSKKSKYQDDTQRTGAKPVPTLSDPVKK